VSVSLSRDTKSFEYALLALDVLRQVHLGPFWILCLSVFALTLTLAPDLAFKDAPGGPPPLGIRWLFLGLRARERAAS